MTVSNANAENEQNNTEEFVTIRIAGQLFGLPIGRVQDVFMPVSMTEVPLSMGEIAGVLNLRGRIVTAINMRTRLNLPPIDKDMPPMAVGIEYKGESYGLIIDEIGEVLRLPISNIEKNPANLDPRWATISAGVQKLDGELMVILNVDRVLDIGETSQAA